MALFARSWTRRGLLRQLDTGAVEEAIRRAEGGTSGEIRVSIAGFFRGDPQDLAHRAFARLEISATRHRNGVLILVAPTRRKIVVLADHGIRARVGESFWAEVANRLASHFRARQFTSGLVEGIQHIGAQLAAHFPPSPDGDVNELSDTVDVARTRDP